FGRSIGSLYAIELARRHPNLAGLIIESGIADPYERFMDRADLSAFEFTTQDVKNEVARLFNHQQKLATYRKRVVLLHTEADGIIDISHAERNHAWAAGHAKRLVRFPLGNHNTIYALNRSEYLAAIRNFVNLIEGTQSS